MNFTLSEPSAAVQLIGGCLIFALVALLALAAKLGAVIHERNIAHNAALKIQRDRDRYRDLLAKERTVNNKVEAERERLAAEVGDLKAINSQLAADLNAEVASLNLRGEMAYDALVVACESVSLPAAERKRNPINGLFMPNDPNYTASVIYGRVKKVYEENALSDVIQMMNDLKDITSSE